jgi:hypothetical protein
MQLLPDEPYRGRNIAAGDGQPSLLLLRMRADFGGRYLVEDQEVLQFEAECSDRGPMISSV